ncbi:hypothetical protein K438DRAFT_497978 [Mycena galopus ATCC 62051]|nr:hypothetical protein K438DRAFT_497978 [Mycena galopus ATCC 62051]
MPEAKLDRDKYFARESFSFGSGEVMENGWIRFTSEFAIGSNFDWGHGRRGLPGEWLSQGNHIFNCFGVASNFEDYVVVNWIEFQLTVPRPIVDPPKGFLFLCPLGDFRIGDTLSFKWPDCPAYWSFDPSGTECISPEEATNLGFPSMRLSTTIWGTSWDSEVYLGLCQFHQGKGFDPDSQEVARQLGYPLYELSPEFQGLFAHMDEDSCNDHDATGEERECGLESSNTAHHGEDPLFN